MHRRPLTDRFWERVEILGPDECWAWLGSTSAAGYAQLGRGGRGGEIIYGHRLSWELHNRPLPAGMMVCHRCDNPPCCNPAHLFIGTHQENMADMRAKGRHSHGERHIHAKLTAIGVELIRSLYAAGGCTQYLLADLFGVSRGAIGHIIQRTTWAEVGYRQKCV